MRGLLLASIFLTLSIVPAHAGFRAYNANTDLKLFTTIQCGDGIFCARNTKKDALVVSASNLGILRERVPAVAGTLTKAQCGSTFYNTAAVELDLPEASTVIGCRYTFVTLNASNFDVDPDAADIILVQTDAAGDRIRNATLGNTITLEAVSASQWAVVGILGTWTDAN